MRSILPALQAALNTRSTTLCLCWLAIRQDGEVYGFTDHDQPLTFGGILYEASSSFVGSDIEDQLGLAVSNMDIMGPLGAISSESITTADLEDGRWDYATISILAVDWSDTSKRAVMVQGTSGQMQSGDLAFQAELRSLGQHFSQYIGSLVQPKCRSNLGDTGSGLEGGCRFSMPAPVTGTIAAVTDRANFKITAAGTYPDGGGGTLSGGYWAFGTVTFPSGPNKGVSREIFLSDPSLNMTTMLPFPEDIAVGDAVSLQLGCDKTPETCRVLFNNIINFRGEPYVPGSDFVFRVNGE